MNRIIKPIKDDNIIKSLKNVVVKILMINDGNMDTLKTRLKKLINVIKYHNGVIKY